MAFLPDKSAAAKEVLFECLFAAQAAVPDAVYTRFVGSDSPHSDLSMLRAVQARVLPHAPRLDAGDDLWHVMDRTMSHRRPAAYGEVRRSLLGVLQRGVVRAKHGVPRAAMPVPSSSLVLPAFRLPAGHVLSERGVEGRWKLCRPFGVAGPAAAGVAGGVGFAASDGVVEGHGLAAAGTEQGGAVSVVDCGGAEHAAGVAGGVGAAAAVAIYGVIRGQGLAAAGAEQAAGVGGVGDAALVPWTPGGQQPDVARTERYSPGFGV